MIVCTSKSDALLRQGVEKSRILVSKVESIIDSFKIDPSTSKPTREAYVIANEDIRSPRLKKEFLEAAAHKNSAVKIIYVSRVAKSDITEGNGIDKVLIKPKPAEIANVINTLVESIAKKAPVLSSADEVAQPIEKFTPKEFMTPTEPLRSSYTEKEEESPVEVREELVVNVQEEQEPVVDDAGSNSMVDRIRECNKVVDIAVLTSELTAAQVMKNIARDNQQYATIEESIRAVKEKIYAVMQDSSIPSLEMRLERIRALLIDKEYYKSKTNSIIEQRVEEIINTIVTTVLKLLSLRLSEIDQALMHASVNSGDNGSLARIAGLTEERANVILELAVLNKEVRNIFYNTDNIAQSIVSQISDEESDITGSPLLNAQLRVRGETVVSESTLNTIVHVLSTSERTTDEFKQAIDQITIMQNKTNKLLALDKETIAAQEQIIQFLTANKIEDGIIAETLIKKAMRIFVAVEGCGRTVVPLVLSSMKSRQSANVLLIDLTGTSKLEDYGVDAIDYAEWAYAHNEKEMCVVVGKCGDSIESMQRLLVALTKAADYYKVINVVVSPEQTELLSIVAHDALCVNYIVDPNRKTLGLMKDFIKETKMTNVAQRVIINKYTSTNCRSIIEELELLDNMEVQVVQVPYIPQLIECGLQKIKPYEVSAVTAEFKVVSEYA